MKFLRFMSSLDLGSWKLSTDWLCMAAANHMPHLKQYCSWMFKRDDWEVTHLHKLIEKEYKNHTIQMPVNAMKTTFSKQEIMPMTVFKNLCHWSKELEMALKHQCRSRWIYLDLLTCNQIIQILLHSLTTEQTGFHGTWSHMHFHFNNWFYSWDLKIITWLSF